MNTSKRTVIIAEIGVNHNGDIGIARDLIVAARDAGADYAKFQTFVSDALTISSAPLAQYQKSLKGPSNQQELLRGLELSFEDFIELKLFAESVGIGFLTTAHDDKSLDFVLQLGLDYIKVPSGDLTNLPMLETIGALRSPILLSTGMADFSEIGDALRILENAGSDRSQITVLQCTTNYPAPIDEANLRAMVAIGEGFSVSVGYSDHTRGITASTAAVALGAHVIEKHLTLDTSMQGPDHAASSTPTEFARLASAVREVERALGSSEKSPTKSEIDNRAIVRKSLVAIRPIHEGQIFSRENVGVKRPGTGVSPMSWHDVMGRASTRAFEVDELIELS